MIVTPPPDTVTFRDPVVVRHDQHSPLKKEKFRRARRAIVAMVVCYFAVSFVLAKRIDGQLANVRDPEYAARRDQLLARAKENPGRPIWLALGSSRMVEGLRPNAINTDHGPLWLNGGMVGSGSMLELMTYRRLKHDGLKPTHVLIEYWPPLLRGGNHAEYGRIDLPRLGTNDWPIVRDYFPDPTSVRRYMSEGQLAPAQRYRRGLLTMVDKKLVPESQRGVPYAQGVDRFGWWPGVRDEDAAAERAKRGDPLQSAFRPYLIDFSIGEPADRAFRDLLNECHADGVQVTLVFLPEGRGFRSLYTAAAETHWNGHLKNLPAVFEWIDARDWSDDADLPDGVHLTQGGATRFTKRLGSALNP